MSISFDMPTLPLGRPAIQVGVFLYLAGEDPNDDQFLALPNVTCSKISRREGPHWSTATFEYVSGNVGQGFPPVYFEQVMPVDIFDGSGYVVQPDDRVVVVGTNPDGSYLYLFDGFMLSPGTNIDHESMAVGFEAVGVERRAWDEPLQDRWERDCDEPTDPNMTVASGRTIRFNPLGRGNATPRSGDVTWEWPGRPVGQPSPVFLDERFEGKDDDGNPYRRKWTLSMAARYILLSGHNDWAKFVDMPLMDDVDPLLDVYTPKPGNRFYNANDPSTYDANPIEVADTDITGMKWPEALAGLLDKAGFSMCFVLTGDAQGFPVTRLVIYKKYETSRSRYKDLYLDRWGSDLDPSMNNLGAADMQRDMSKLVNQITVHTAPVLVEVSFVLAPLFDIAAADANNKKVFNVSDPAYDPNSHKYRWWGIDELGEGHWDMKNWVHDTSILDLSKVFPLSPEAQSAADLVRARQGDPFGDGAQLTPEDDNSTIGRDYVRRRRPPKHFLLTRDDSGQRLDPMLHVSCDYAGPTPAIWDRSGTWTEIPYRHSWNVLDDRCGIQFTGVNPNAWKMWQENANKTAPGQFSAGEIHAVEWLAKGKVAAVGDTAGNFFLMLTCVLDSDQFYELSSDKRPTSPTSFVIHNAIDMRSEYRPGRILSRSFNDPAGDDQSSKDIPTDFDGDEAQAFSDSKREANHYGRFAVKAHIPRLTAAYQVGDRIRSVNGRNCDLQMGLSGGRELPVYPKVIGVDWELKEKQNTILVLADADIVRVPRRRHR